MSKSSSSESEQWRKEHGIPRKNISLKCTLCDESWTGQSLPKLAKRIAWHWNKDHHSELRFNETQIDTVERGGHHIHGNEWTVERIPIYITAFDVLEDRLGKEDGWATVGDEETVCQECLRETPKDERIECDEDSYKTTIICESCQEQNRIENIQETNRSLFEFENP